MSLLCTANLGLRFLLELCALAAFGYWGFRVGPNLAARFVLGLGSPMLSGGLLQLLPLAGRGPIHDRQPRNLRKVPCVPGYQRCAIRQGHCGDTQILRADAYPHPP
jgi:hypothetical protein